MEHFFNALLISSLAGLATGFGSLIILFMSRKRKYTLSLTLSIASGVMANIAICELFYESRVIGSIIYGTQKGLLISVFTFTLGISVVILITLLSKKRYNEQKYDDNLTQVGFVTMLALIIHNFPEGFATFLTSYQSVSFGITIGLGIALHNVFEGAAIAIPYYYGGRSKKWAISKSFLSGMSEPIGAVIAFVFLEPFLTPLLFSLLYGFIGGIMFFVSLFQLYPNSVTKDKEVYSIVGFVIGFLIMGLFSLIY